MIDYDKLREACQLSHKARPKNGCITVDFAYHIGSVGELRPLYNIYTEDNDGMTDELQFYDVNDLLNKLRELTQPEPKYKPGDIVWIVKDEQPQSIAVHKNSGPKYYLDGHIGLIYESELYPTKTALIESQIAHWSKMKDENESPQSEGAIIGLDGKCLHNVTARNCYDCRVGDCQHESNSTTTSGIIHSCEGDIDTPFKCIKCGEFYK